MITLTGGACSTSRDQAPRPDHTAAPASPATSSTSPHTTSSSLDAASTSTTTGGDALPIAAGVTVETVVAEIDAGTGGLAIDDEGNLYSADFGYTNHRGNQVLQVLPDGTVSVYFSDDVLWTASGNVVGPDGLLYQSSFANSKILGIEPGGAYTELVDDVEGVVGVAVAVDRTLYVASCREDVIERIDPDGAKELFAFDPGFDCPNGLILAPDGNLYTANYGNGKVHRITMEAEVVEIADLPGDNNGHLGWRDGELVVAGRGANQVFGVGLDGKVRVIAGSGELGLADGAGPDSALGLPNGVAIGPGGEIYVNQSTATDGTSNNPQAIRVISIEE